MRDIEIETVPNLFIFMAFGAPIVVFGVFATLFEKPAEHVAALMQTMIKEEDAEGSTVEFEQEEVLAPEKPEWLVHTAENRTPCNSAARRQSELDQRKTLRQQCLCDVGFGFVYIVLSNPFYTTEVGGEVFFGGLALAFVLFVTAAIRYLMFRNQYRVFSDHGPLVSLITWLILLIWHLSSLAVTLLSFGRANISDLPDYALSIFGARGRFFIGLIVIIAGFWAGLAVALNTELNALFGGIGLLSASVIHLCGLFVQTRLMIRQHGLKLLILRVFEEKENSDFTFQGLMRNWAHFGTHYTIGDIVLYRQKLDRWYYILPAFALCLVWAAVTFAITILSLNLFDVHIVLGWLFVPLIITLLIYGPTRLITRALGWWIERPFLRSQADLDRRLAKLDWLPRHIDLRFRHLHAMCFNNTWFPTVAALAQRADVVLMDLRNFSPQRKGCEREVDFLFDAVPLQEILFLVDSHDDQQAIRDMLEARFKYLRKTSPNLNLKAPKLHVFEVRDIDQRNKQGILDWLISAASEKAQGKHHVEKVAM